ncbi:hypothetical protein [Clostridium beijerinckii]|uniref:hypothetical protein n=1 Tax=Clostridium beijerinckii TaxID=1520 RepID=UPI001F333326|nr:hypothetical protein [Clostridium beijerinckii]
MNTYSITLWGNDYTEIAETAGKAKYRFFRDHEIGDFVEFGEFIKQVKCSIIGKFHVKDLFTQDIESFERMKQLRGIEFAFLGMKVEVNGKKGVIVGNNHSLNLDVCFDNQYWKENCHPWWRIKYFDNYGNIIKEFKD